MSKVMFDPTMNRWLNYYNEFAVHQNAVWKEGYDDPTYLTFKIEFGDWGASVLDKSVLDLGVTTFKALYADYDEFPMGLLNCPWGGDGHTPEVWQNGASMNSDIFNATPNYSAFTFLRSRNEDTRAEYIYYFVNGLLEIQRNTPYIFQKISGLDTLEQLNVEQGLRLKDAAITLECIEGLDLKIKTLMELYRKAAWDDVYQRWILPENLRQFKMIIYVFERRTFQDYLFGLDQLNFDIPVKAYECSPCEFDLTSSPWRGDYNTTNESPMEGSTIKIKIKNVKTFYRNGLLNTLLHQDYNSVDGKATEPQRTLSRKKYEEAMKDDPKAPSYDEYVALQKELKNQSIQAKVEPLFIYDLVDRIDKYNALVATADTNLDAVATNAKSLNAVRAMFMQKNVFLLNEDFSGNALNHRTWILTLVSAPLWDKQADFWKQLGEATKKILTNGSRSVMVGGDITLVAGKIATEALSYLFESQEEDFYVSKAVIDSKDSPLYEMAKPFMEGNNLKTINGDRILSKATSNEIVNGIYELLDPREHVEQNLLQLLKERQLDNQEIQTALEEVMPAELQFAELEPERSIPDDNFEELEPERKLPNDKFNELEKERNLPKDKFNELEPERSLPKDKFNELEPERKLPDDKFNELEKERNLPDDPFNELEKERKLPDDKFNELDPERKLPKQKFNELDPERKLPATAFPKLEDHPISLQEFMEMEEARNVPKQTSNVLLPPTRPLPKAIDDLLLAIRNIPGLEDVTIEDVRKLPEQALESLADADERLKPDYQVNSLELIDIISKAVDEPNADFIRLNDELKKQEAASLKSIIDNKALQTLLPVPNPTPEAEKKQKVLALIKAYAENADEIQDAYALHVIDQKNLLMSLTDQAIRELPDVELYQLKPDERKKNADKLISLNDTKQISDNIPMIALKDDTIKDMSMEILVSLNDKYNEEITKTQSMIGLSKEVERKVEKQNMNKLESPKAEKSRRKKLGSTNMMTLEDPRDVKRDKIVY